MGIPADGPPRQSENIDRFAAMLLRPNVLAITTWSMKVRVGGFSFL